MAQTIRPMCPTNARAHADAHAECTIAGIPETASALEQNLCDIPRQLAMAGDGERRKAKSLPATLPIAIRASHAAD